MRRPAAPISLQLEEAEGSLARLSVYLSLAYAVTIWHHHFTLEHSWKASVPINWSGALCESNLVRKIEFYVHSVESRSVSRGTLAIEKCCNLL